MSNDAILIVSYFGVAVVCVGIGAAVFVYLRHEFAKASTEAIGTRFARLLQILFPSGIILPALAGFLAVAYQGGCNQRTYEQIASDKALLFNINKMQISSALSYIVYALGAWIVIILLGALRRQSPATRPSRSARLG